MTLFLLIGSLVFLIMLSAFFSIAETGLMSVNRYRLRHLARIKRHRAAQRAKKLLERPDRLLSGILIGNNCANIFASAIAATIANNLFGHFGVAIITLILTFVILIFAEVVPKTLAAMQPEQVAFAVSLPLTIILNVFYPVVWFVNVTGNSILRIFGFDVKKTSIDHLSVDELRSVLKEAGGKIPEKNLDMLLSILDLERETVDDIMIPRSEINAIDITEEWEKIATQLQTCQHTRLPVYRGELDQVIGIINVRNILSLILQQQLQKDLLMANLQAVHFVPEATSLSQQLLNFQRENARSGLVVDEYGDILGLVTVEDIVEEIVGEFSSEFGDMGKEIHPQDDGSYLIDGSIALRRLNRLLNWRFPTRGPKTLSGLIIEMLEMIPRPATCLRVKNYPLEIVQVKDNMVKTVRVMPELPEQK